MFVRTTLLRGPDVSIERHLRHDLDELFGQLLREPSELLHQRSQLCREQFDGHQNMPFDPRL